MADFYVAMMDDWTVVYNSDGKELFQHHYPHWQDVFEWCGKEVEVLSYEESPGDWKDWMGFPDTLDKWREHKLQLDQRDEQIQLKDIEIAKLQEQIDKLRKS